MPERENPESIDHNASSNQLLGLLEPTEDLTLEDWRHLVDAGDESLDGRLHLVDTSMRILDEWSSCSARALRSPTSMNNVRGILSQAGTILNDYIATQEDHIPFQETASFLQYQASTANSLEQIRYLAGRFDVHFPDTNNIEAKRRLLDVWYAHQAIKAEFQDYEEIAAELAAEPTAQLPEGITLTGTEVNPDAIIYTSIEDIANDLELYAYTYSFETEPFDPTPAELQNTSNMLRGVLRQSGDNIASVGPQVGNTQAFTLVYIDEIDTYELSPNNFDPYSPASPISKFSFLTGRELNFVPSCTLNFSYQEAQEDSGQTVIPNLPFAQFAELIGAVTGQPEYGRYDTGEDGTPPEPIPYNNGDVGLRTEAAELRFAFDETSENAFSLKIDLDPRDRQTTNKAMHRLFIWSSINTERSRG